MKHLANDTHGAERILTTFVLLAAFIGVSAYMVTQMTGWLAETSGYWDEVEPYEVIGGREFALKNVTPMEGYVVVPADCADNIVDCTEFDFEDETLDNREIMVEFIVDSSYYDPTPPWYWDADAKKMAKYEDFVRVSSYRGYSEKHTYISFDHIRECREDTNLSIVDFRIGQSNARDIYSLLIETHDGPENHNVNIQIGNFTVMVRIPVEPDSDVLNTSMWSLIGQMFTGKIPGVNDVVNKLIQIPLLAATGFLIFTLLSRVIPFIAGG